MNWNRRNRIASYLRSSLWIVPVGAVILELIVVNVLLTNTLAAERGEALRRELSLLDQMIEKLYVLPEDLALARIPDSQSLGATTHATAAKMAA